MLTRPSLIAAVAVVRREEELRVAAAKAALTAKLVGYEGGFPPSAESGDQQSAAELVESVVSAEHIPVPKEKVQAAREAVVLLLNGQPTQSLQRDGLTFSPVQLIKGRKADSFEVLMEAPTLLYRTNAEARVRKEQQICDAEKRIADAKATLAELQQALGRSAAAFKAAVEAAADPDGDSELSDIGAMAIEQQRITSEITRQQGISLAQGQRLTELQRLADSQLQLTEQCIAPTFRLHSGYNSFRAQGEEQAVQVMRKANRHEAEKVQFSSAVDAK